MSQPQTTEKINVEYIKNHYKLTDFVLHDMGEPEKEKERSMLYLCPFHAEDTPSFYVDKGKQSYKCFGCQRHGSIVDFVIERGYAHDFQDVIRYFTGDKKSYTPAPIVRKAIEPTSPKKKPTMAEVQHFHKNRQTAITYFNGRGIQDESVDKFLLGAQINYNWSYRFKCEEYAEQAQSESVSFVGKRYTYPWMSGNDVRMINKRRDDAAALDTIKTKNPDLIRLIRCDLAKRHNNNPLRTENWTPFDVSDKRLLDDCFGPRFDQFGAGTIFNLNRLFQLDDEGKLIVTGGLPVVKRLHYCLIVEGEADAIAAEQCGFVAVAAKVQVGVDYKHAFSGTYQPIICVDSDQAGQGYGQSMRDQLGRGRFLPMKAGFKDVNDMVKAGLFIDWVKARTLLSPAVKNIEF